MSAAGLLAALALAGAPLTPGDRAPPVVPAGAERAEILLRFPPWMYTGTFSLTVLGLTDRGVARDDGSLVGPQKQVERVLSGEKGTLTLLLRTEERAGFPPIVGFWEVKGGTGAYAGLAGGGTFSAADGGLAKVGCAFEVQALIGRLGRR